MTLRLNDNNDTVAKWRHVMAAMFPGYMRPPSNLGPLAPGTLFGPRAVEWQKEYERRTGQVQDGIVSDQDLLDLHIVYPYRPIWCYSAPGSGVPWWVGPPFDLGERCKQLLHLNHQPIGYPIGGYLGLMGGSPSDSYIDIIKQLDVEHERLLDNNPDVQRAMRVRAQVTDAPVDVEIWEFGYSQSADGMKKSVARLFGDGGKYAILRDRLNRLVFYGDPARQKGNGSAPGWGIARYNAPAWLERITHDITVVTPAPDFYAACDDEIRPLFYEWFIRAETSMGFVVYCGQIIIPAILNLVAPFLKGFAGLTNPLAATILSAQSGLPIDLISSLIGGMLGSNEKPDPKIIEFLSIKGILTNLPQLLKLLGDLQGVAAHGDYYTPRKEFGGRDGIQVGYDIVAGFRR